MVGVMKAVGHGGEDSQSPATQAKSKCYIVGNCACFEFLEDVLPLIQEVSLELRKEVGHKSLTVLK